MQTEFHPFANFLIPLIHQFPVYSSTSKPHSYFHSTLETWLFVRQLCQSGSRLVEDSSMWKIQLWSKIETGEKLSVKGDFYMPSLIVAIAGSQHTKPKLKSIVSSTKMLFTNIIFKTLITGSNNISVYIRCEVNFSIYKLFRSSRYALPHSSQTWVPVLKSSPSYYISCTTSVTHINSEMHQSRKNTKRWLFFLFTWYLEKPFRNYCI